MSLIGVFILSYSTLNGTLYCNNDMSKKLGFSQRMGIKPDSKEVQINSMDDDLRNGLWNVVQRVIIIPLHEKGQYNYNPLTDMVQFLWDQYFKHRLDESPRNDNSAKVVLKEKFFAFTWDGVYDFIEYLSELNLNQWQISTKNLIKSCNEILEREFSGYRFVNGIISPITNSVEVGAVEEAIANTRILTSLKGANTHLNDALLKMSEKTNPDYRNSIKESISALESVTKAISNNKKDSLGSALEKLKENLKIHPALERGFKQIYGWTSDGDGIRHGLMDDSTCDLEDARFMLITCSAFINYLVVKSDKVGIKLDD